MIRRESDRTNKWPASLESAKPFRISSRISQTEIKKEKKKKWNQPSFTLRRLRSKAAAKDVISKQETGSSTVFAIGANTR